MLSYYIALLVLISNTQLTLYSTFSVQCGVQNVWKIVRGYGTQSQIYLRLFSSMFSVCSVKHFQVSYFYLLRNKFMEKLFL